MKSSHRIIYPLFCWLLFIGYGIQDAESQIGWIVLGTSLAMIALPDWYFRHYLRGTKPLSKWDIAAFFAGTVASAIYFVMLAKSLSGRSVSWGA